MRAKLKMKREGVLAEGSKKDGRRLEEFVKVLAERNGDGERRVVLCGKKRRKVEREKERQEKK